MLGSRRTLLKTIALRVVRRVLSTAVLLDNSTAIGGPKKQGSFGFLLCSLTSKSGVLNQYCAEPHYCNGLKVPPVQSAAVGTTLSLPGL